MQRSVKHAVDATMLGRLERLVRREGSQRSETPVDLPKAEAGKPDRAPASFQPDVTEAAVSMAEKLTTPITVSEAGQRNAWNV